jgi:hypothetical protein
MTSLTFFHPLSGWVVTIAALLLIAVIIVAVVLGTLLSGSGPAALEWFSFSVAAASVVMFFGPSQFLYHFMGWLAPFFALSLALPVARCAEVLRNILPSPHPWPHAMLIAMAVPVIGAFAALQVAVLPVLPPAPVISPSLDRLVPPGSCLLSDTSPPLVMIGRLVSVKPGCVILLDSMGADLELSHGLKPDTGAWRSAPLERMWWRAFRKAQYVLLRTSANPRVPWTPVLRAWFQRNFSIIYRQKFFAGNRVQSYNLYRRRPSVAAEVSPSRQGQSG